MFVLNDTECKILKKILQRDNFDSDYNFKGLTTYGMTKNKGIAPGNKGIAPANKGIAPANWSKYKDKLLYFQLVSENFEKVSKPRRPRKSESKINFKEKI